MALSTGAIGALLPRLHLLSSNEEHGLPMRQVKFVIRRLEEIQVFLHSMWSEKPPEKLHDLDKLWEKQAGDLARHLGDMIDEFQVNITGARRPSSTRAVVHLPGGLIDKKTAKARRKVVSNIRDLVEEFTRRLQRYRIESPLLPRHLAGPYLDEFAVDLPKNEQLARLRLPSWVRFDIASLKPELEAVKVVLRMLAEVPADELGHGARAWAEDLREVMGDLKLAADNFNSATTDKARRQFAIDIADIKQSFLEAAERRERCDFGVFVKRRRSFDDEEEGDTLLSSASAQPRLDPANLVSIDGHRDSLVELLTGKATTSKQQLRVASIVGVAGVGKTTLAKEVYRILAPQFDCTAWVSLPSLPDPEMKPVLQDLLQQISKQPGQHSAPQATYGQLGALQVSDAQNAAPERMDESVLIEKIRHTLKDKRYIVIVEDIWDSTSWDSMKHALMENRKDSAVMITSRKTDIAEYVLTSINADTGKCIYRLEPLSGPDSKKLLHERLLFHFNGRSPHELAEKYERLIEKCGGIPLAIVDTAGLLANKPWTVKESVDYDLRLDEINGIVADAFTDIPRHLKPCLLYFSMFQKGYVISSERLVCGWIAEGFIPESRGQTLHVGETYLNELIKRNMVEALEFDAAGKALFCRVYDLIHEWMIIREGEDIFATVLDGKQGRFSNEVYRLSIQGNSLEHPLPQEHLSRMRLLIISGDVSMPSLSDFKELRALDLGACDSLQDDHLRGIENPFLLKYLVIGGNFITGIPKEIVTLSLLQTLDLRSSGLNILPACIFMLTQLERLFVSDHMKIPNGIGKMSSLQELGDINVSMAELLKELACLAELRILRFAIWSWDEGIKSYDEPLLEYLHSLVERNKKIQCLSILTCSSLQFMDRLRDKWAPPSLQILEIRYSVFDKLTSWVDSLEDLTSLSIEVYNLSQETIDMLGRLPSLCSLSLTSKNAAEGMFGLNTDGFKNLTGFNYTSNVMKSIFVPKSKSMHKLKRIKLSFHVSRTKHVNHDFKFGLENLSSLEHVHVEIICFNVRRHLVKQAEDAIEEAISKGRSRRTRVDIQRVQGENILEEVVTSGNGEQHQQKETVTRKKKYYIC